jgi:hypothetical protein
VLRQNQRRFTPAAALPVLALALAVCLAATSLSAGVVVAKNMPSALGTEIRTFDENPVVVFTFSKYADTGYAWLNYNDETGFACSNQIGMRKFSDKRAFVNWHPFGSSFRFSAGAFSNEDTIAIINHPKTRGSTMTIGGNTYAASQVGIVRGDVELARNIEPYVGFGWSKRPVNGGIGYFADFGFLFTSGAKTALSATGPIASDPTFQANLQKEADGISHDLKPLRYYPIVQAGLLYRF